MRKPKSSGTGPRKFGNIGTTQGTQGVYSLRDMGRLKPLEDLLSNFLELFNDIIEVFGGRLIWSLKSQHIPGSTHPYWLTRQTIYRLQIFSIKPHRRSQGYCSQAVNFDGFAEDTFASLGPELWVLFY